MTPLTGARVAEVQELSRSERSGVWPPRRPCLASPRRTRAPSGRRDGREGGRTSSTRRGRRERVFTMTAIPMLTLSLATLLLVSISRATPPPNILLIFTDDQGINDVGCYGSEIPTPNIDRIAAEGIQFNSFYSASSICTPSRFGLLTGQNPVRSQDQLLG